MYLGNIDETATAAFFEDADGEKTMSTEKAQSESVGSATTIGVLVVLRRDQRLFETGEACKFVWFRL